MVKAIDVNKFDQNFIYTLDTPMPKWRWMAKFIGPDIPGVDFNALLVERIAGPNGETLQVDSSFGGGRTTYFPSFPDSGPITLSIYETDAGAANLSIANWKEKVKSQEGWYGLPVDYKCRLIVNLFGYQSNTQPVYTYSFEGVWPSDAGQLDLSYTEDDRIIITGTFSTDRILTGARAG
jgi:hypothetical protein